MNEQDCTRATNQPEWIEAPQHTHTPLVTSALRRLSRWLSVAAVVAVATVVIVIVVLVVLVLVLVLAVAMDHQQQEPAMSPVSHT